MAEQQGGLWDIEIEDAEFEEALEDWLQDAENRKRSGKIARQRKAGFERHSMRLKAGQRVRVGAYFFDVVEVERDAYEVEASLSKRATNVQRVMSE
jgi:hypothetical protein